jgi:hypothetical protein
MWYTYHHRERTKRRRMSHLARDTVSCSWRLGRRSCSVSSISRRMDVRCLTGQTWSRSLWESARVTNGNVNMSKARSRCRPLRPTSSTDRLAAKLGWAHPVCSEPTILHNVGVNDLHPSRSPREGLFRSVFVSNPHKQEEETFRTLPQL